MTATAQERINALDARVRKVARLVSLATGVEPALLRAARLAAEAPASVEAELWFSGVVSGHGRFGLVLDSAVADALRSDLAGDPPQRDEAWSIVCAHHAARPWSLRLEERISYLTTLGADGAGEIEELLTAALLELRAVSETDEAAAVGIARWLLAALTRLPGIVRGTRTAAVAGVVAGAHLDGRAAGLDALDDETRRRWLPTLLERLGTAWLWVRLLPDGVLAISAAEDRGVPLEVPATDPRVVTVRSGEWRQDVRVRRGEVWSGEVPGHAIELRTLAGGGLTLRPGRIGRVMTGERALGAGFAVTPTAVLTAAHVVGLADVPYAYVPSAVEPAVAVTAVESDQETGTALLRLARAVPGMLPVGPPRLNVWCRVGLEPADEAIVMRGIVEGQSLSPPRLQILLQPGARLDPGVAGSPLTAEDPWGAVVGIVLSAVPGPLGPDRTTRLAPVVDAVPIEPVLARFGLQVDVVRAGPAPLQGPLIGDLVTLLVEGRLPRAQEVDPVALGVVPSGGSSYVVRDVDRDLRALLARGSPVTVTGPPGSGRSRTAFEAVLATHPEAPFAVPRSAGALRQLLEQPGPAGVDGDVIVWLDDAVPYESVPRDLWEPRWLAVVTSQPGAEPRDVPRFSLPGELSEAERARAERAPPPVAFADYVPALASELDAAHAELERLRASGSDEESLARALERLAAAQLADQRFEEAVASAGEASALWRGLADRDPRRFGQAYVRSLDMLAEAQSQIGDLGATETWEAALRTARWTAEQNPEARRLLAEVLERSAARLWSPEPERAIAFKEEALTLRLELLEEDETLGRVVVGTLDDLVAMYSATKEAERAVDAAAAAVASFRDLVPDRPAYRQHLARCLVLLANALKAAGRDKEADEARREARAIGRDDPR